MFFGALLLRLDFFVSKKTPAVQLLNSEIFFSDYKSRPAKVTANLPNELIKFPNVQALYAAVWRGDLGLFPSAVKEFYFCSGTLAVLALSGQHVWILFGIVSTLGGGFIRCFYFYFSAQFWWLHTFRRRGFREEVILLCALCLFLTSGQSSSTLRTLSLCLSVYGVRHFSRSSSPIQCLTTSTALLVFVDPTAIFQPGFVLSFFGVLIVFLFEGFHGWLPVVFPLLSYPLLAYFFGKISLSAPLLSLPIEWIWIQVWIPLGFLLPLFLNRVGVLLLLPGIESSLEIFFKLHRVMLPLIQWSMQRVAIPHVLDLILLEIWGLGGALILLSYLKKQQNSQRVED